MTLEEQLLLHEGLRLKPYRDTAGKLTIGVGRNLTDRGITEWEAYQLLRTDIVETQNNLNYYLPWAQALSPIRQRVLIDMAFNLGIGGLLKFKATLAAAKAGDYHKAAEQMLKSRWARQVGQRAKRLAEMMRTNRESTP